MAKPDSDLTVTPSLIDRLIDRDPRASTDPHTTRAQSVRQLKAALRRDLEWLLNTRRNPDAAADSLAELSHSLFNYGLPDFSSLSLNSPARSRTPVGGTGKDGSDLRAALTAGPGELVDAPGHSSRVVHFQIEGMLQMDPSPEQVSFDTTLQLSSGEYQIRGERSA